MPTSDCHGVSAIMVEIQRLGATKVLELGIGFGKWGTLLRELLDGQHGRCAPEGWQATIWGVEIFKEYRNPVWGAYTGVDIADFAGGGKTTWTNQGWDLVMMIDSLEHVPPERGRALLSDLVQFNRQVIISVPNGRMDQGTVFGNPYETHHWTFNDLEEFERFTYKVLHRGVCTVVSIKGCLA